MDSCWSDSRRRGEDAELAFAALVDRHGPMVLRVCRGVLRDPDDADDAFQAAFLVLAIKARSILRGDSVGSWLFGVAMRVASDARFAAARRRMHEGRAAGMRGESVCDGDGPDWGPEVHGESAGYRSDSARRSCSATWKASPARETARPGFRCTVGTVEEPPGTWSRTSSPPAHPPRLFPPGLFGGNACVRVGPGRGTRTKAHTTIQLALQFAARPALVGDGMAVTFGVETLVKGALNTMLLSKLRIATFALLASGP